MRTALTTAELEERLAAEFPEVFYPGCGLSILAVAPRGARVRLVPERKATRPGGTVAGPVLMLLADVAMYIAVLASVGWVPSRSRPTSISIS